MIPTLSTLFIPKSVKEYGSGKLDGKLGLELLKTLLLLGLSGSSAGPRIFRRQGFQTPTDLGHASHCRPVPGVPCEMPISVAFWVG